MNAATDGFEPILLTRITNPFTFTGRRYDPETALYYYRARYYDPKLGRFIGRDPIGFEGSEWNLYEYVKGRPVGELDPTGKSIGGLVGVYLLGEAACESLVGAALFSQATLSDWDDKFSHCYVSCRPTRICGKRVTQMTGIAWEVKDEVGHRLGADPEGYSHGDIRADMDGADCGGGCLTNVPLLGIGNDLRGDLGFGPGSCGKCCQEKGYKRPPPAPPLDKGLQKFIEHSSGGPYG